MARRKRVEIPKTELNITSMMDLVLNLLAFFVLTSNFALAELPHLEVPVLAQSTARTNESPNKVTVNVLPAGDSGLASTIKVGVFELSKAELSRLPELLATEKSKSADVTIDLRADKSIRYDEIAPIMRAITDAGITKVNLVAGLPD